MQANVERTSHSGNVMLALDGIPKNAAAWVISTNALRHAIASVMALFMGMVVVSIQRTLNKALKNQIQ
jgi:phage I-like protein